MTDWLDSELSGCEFKDKRLGDRFKKIAKALASGSGKSIPQVCEEWAKVVTRLSPHQNKRLNL